MYVYGILTENDISVGGEKARDSLREREGASGVRGGVLHDIARLVKRFTSFLPLGYAHTLAQKIYMK